LILEIARDVLSHISGHAPHLDGLNEVEHGRMEALEGYVAQCLGVAHVEAFVAEGGDVGCGKGVLELLLLFLGAFVYLVKGLLEFTLFLAFLVLVEEVLLLVGGWVSRGLH